MTTIILMKLMLSPKKSTNSGPIKFEGLDNGQTVSAEKRPEESISINEISNFGSPIS